MNDLVCRKCGKHFRKKESDALCDSCLKLWWAYYRSRKDDTSLRQVPFTPTGESLADFIWKEFLSKPIKVKVLLI